MLAEGLKLTFIGMGTVYVFLAILITCMNLTSKILKPFTDKEFADHERELEEAARARAEANVGNDGAVVAAISAAIEAHRK
ncbi:MAG: hypothetical protein A2504_07615 [Bdellovibrionales bacterium RIFOXYD12_FULL_39_22]|nr:MAG: hypothetical protein A2385_10940 [Bdellovibrionales bacterium RIFOXYB1_FULL_39_21]OFZ41301.1 MAG: hypothetical protein A2485_00745 [Bdellovibrionales bacterium RIFOXYC12_FULL_39_17]OFZ45049.1 MAG: hypothetical protein A2404_11235 [Bdellovibrionales bacterium RIFOXYC1_FULL_39_130]OFZ74433.1 MAG: hypothetical protein A2560_11270 [Bdellovibrionales bacterium RIFOXYD1_FULL_39_84]OFZ92445.1 MAG: hypothetical protein A2504_07615 [Bdellovibrionales bacterium RIFOXYD12_FULL_39_22]HLE12495.1 Oa